MKCKIYHFKNATFFDEQRFSISIHVKYLVLIFLFTQLENFCFAQQSLFGKANDELNIVPSATVSKSTGEENSAVNYSFASFPGGDQAFMLYMLRNIRPPQFYNKPADIKILVTFTIEESGKLKNFRASEGPKALKKEAIRVVKDSGRWIPAYKDGKPIASEREQKISFILNK